MPAPPMTRSQGSWNPAVPPPPVSGAVVGVRRSRCLGLADGDADAEWCGFGLLDLCLGLGLLLRGCELGLLLRGCELLAPGLGLPLPGELLDDAEAEPLAPGERLVGVADGVDPLQPATDAEVRMARAAQPAAAAPRLSLIRTLTVPMSRRSPRAERLSEGDGAERRANQPGTAMRKDRRASR
jgi:hypothetical protein